jgi:hypothetical protein
LVRMWLLLNSVRWQETTIPAKTKRTNARTSHGLEVEVLFVGAFKVPIVSIFAETRESVYPAFDDPLSDREHSRRSV